MGVVGKEVPGPQLRKFIFPNKMFILHIKQRREGARLLLAQQGAGGEGCVASPATGLQIQGQWRTVSTVLGTAWVGQAIKSEAGYRTPEGSGYD